MPFIKKSTGEKKGQVDVEKQLMFLEQDVSNTRDRVAKEIHSCNAIVSKLLGDLAQTTKRRVEAIGREVI